MPCYHPRNVVRSWARPNKVSGKPIIFFGKSAQKFYNFCTSSKEHFRFYRPEVFQVPGCKPKCVGCQEIYSRQWAVRAWHEAQLHEQNCFITLTFSDKFLPKELDHFIFQKFMKRFRRSISQPVSFFMAGEYGSLNFRPHFHACIFGFDFSDRVLWSVRDGVNLYTSQLLSSLWSDVKTGESYGFTSVGDVTFESAAYIARYVGKKAGRSVAELDGRKPEYSKCSLKRPIGKGWISAYVDSVYPDDAVTLVDGRKCKPPRYYDRFLSLTNENLSFIISSRRKQKMKSSVDNTPERLRERESVKQAQLAQLKRSL